MSDGERFEYNEGDIRVAGYLHEPYAAARAALILTHGAGSNCNAPLLRTLTSALVDRSFTVLRFDLPFRQLRPAGAPHPAHAGADRHAICVAAKHMRSVVSGPLIAGGHSYGGRQTSMAAADDSTMADALLLLAYPLHPPRKPAELRTAHFPRLQVPTLFVSGDRDPFGSPDEIRAAVSLIRARTSLITCEKDGHSLTTKGVPEDIARLLDEFVFQKPSQT